MNKILIATLIYSLGMTFYYFTSQPEETHKIIFWSMLTLFNNQNLIKINQNKEDE